MAETQAKPDLRASTPTVEEWAQTTSNLIEAASTYAEAGQYDAETDGMIRRIRVMASALQAALQNVMIAAPPPTPVVPLVAPMMPPPAVPAPAAETRQKK